MPRQHVRRKKNYDDFDDWLENEGDEDTAFKDLKDRYGSVTGKQQQYILSYFIPIVKSRLKGHYYYRHDSQGHKRGQFAKKSDYEKQEAS